MTYRLKNLERNIYSPCFFIKSSTEFEGQNQGKTLIPRKIFIPARVGEVCGDVQLRGDQSPLRA